MLTSQDLQRFINQQQITAEILPMSKDTPTVPDAARALEVKEEQIIKSLVFLVAEYPTGDGRPVLVIANGTGRVDDRLVARHWRSPGTLLAPCLPSGTRARCSHWWTRVSSISAKFLAAGVRSAPCCA
jgi:prolyl-tRNA editing enzyme YbaK/EbsC (Cys-tRNA(Pro) deacylase)